MQALPTPTEDDDAPIPPDTVSNDANTNPSVRLRRKAAKRTLPWDQAAGELDRMPSSWSPQAEDIPAVATKKLRLEELLPNTTDKAARKTVSPDVSLGLPPPAADDGDDADAVTDTQPNDGKTRATARWTTDEDAKLTRAVANTSKKKHGKDYRTDWATISALVPGRTKIQCWSRWDHPLDPSIGRANGRTVKWVEDEDIKLKDALQTHGSKDWVAISALVPGRTKIQCKYRWHNCLLGLEHFAPAKDNDDTDANTDAVTDTQPNVLIGRLVASGHRRRCKAD
jgi:hypothetical protein